MFVCVCVCVCVWEREREREMGGERKREMERECVSGGAGYFALMAFYVLTSYNLWKNPPSHFQKKALHIPIKVVRMLKRVRYLNVYSQGVWMFFFWWLFICAHIVEAAPYVSIIYCWRVHPRTACRYFAHTHSQTESHPHSTYLSKQPHL